MPAVQQDQPYTYEFPDSSTAVPLDGTHGPGVFRIEPGAAVRVARMLHHPTLDHFAISNGSDFAISVTVTLESETLMLRCRKAEATQ